MKNVSAPAAEQLGVTLISDEENGAGVEIPDTAHQISTGAFLLLSSVYTLLLNWGFMRLNELGNILQIRGFRWGLY